MVLPNRSQRNNSLKANVLIVDNDVDFVDTWTKLFNSAGYKTMGETSPLNVEKLVKDKSFDIILLDLKMPLYSGADVLIDVMSHSLSHRVVIISGAVGETREVVECLHRGASDYISKPFQTNELVERILTTLEGPTRFNPIAVREYLIQKCLWSQVQSSDEYRGHPLKDQIKGKRLVQLIKLIFESVPYFSNIRTNIKSRSEEIDIEIENKGSDAFWAQCGTYILAECKNWFHQRVPETKDYDNFLGKLQRRRKFCKLGFFISMSGFSKGFGEEVRSTRKTGECLVVPIHRTDVELLVNTQNGEKREAILRELIHNVLYT